MRKRIEHIQLEILISQQQILVLGMDIDKSVTQLLELCNSNRCIVYKSPAATRHRHLATHNTFALVIFEFILIKEGFQIVPLEIEATLYYALIGTFAHHLCIGTLSEHH